MSQISRRQISLEGAPEGAVLTSDGQGWIAKALPNDPRYYIGTGVLTGGLVTFGSTTFTVAAGTGVADTWVDPANPVRVIVGWNAFTGESVPNLVNGLFTTLFINPLAALVKVDSVPATPQQKRTLIQLQAISHPGTTITGISQSAIPAYEQVRGALDYIEELGPINRGNIYGAGVTANLKESKGAGTTALPFINRDVDPQNPARKINDPVDPAPFTYSFLDTGSVFKVISNDNDVDPDQYNPSAGPLVAVGNNKFTIQPISFFGQTGNGIHAYGQFEYNTLTEAEEALDDEDRDENPLLSFGRTTTFLIVKQGVTNLVAAILADEAKYVENKIGGTGGGGGGGGEANTASNLGTGEGLAAAKVGVDLPFKSIVAGSNVSLASDADELTISSSAGAALGGASIYLQATLLTPVISTGSYQDLALFNPASHNAGGGLSFNATTGETTFDTAGDYKLSCVIVGVTAANNRVQVDMQAQVDTGAGYGVLAGAFDAQYAMRNNTQDSGSAQIGDFIYTATAGDKVKFQYKDVGGAFTPLVDSTRITIEGLGGNPTNDGLVGVWQVAVNKTIDDSGFSGQVYNPFTYTFDVLKTYLLDFHVQFDDAGDGSGQRLKIRIFNDTDNITMIPNGSDPEYRINNSNCFVDASFKIYITGLSGAKLIEPRYNSNGASNERLRWSIITLTDVTGLVNL